MLLYVEGLVIATILASRWDCALGSSRRIAQALGPLLEFLRATPAAAIVPGRSCCSMRTPALTS